MIHYWMELALWMAGLFLLGCPLGAAARGLVAPPGPAVAPEPSPGDGTSGGA